MSPAYPTYLAIFFAELSLNACFNISSMCLQEGQLHLRGLFFERESGSDTKFKILKHEAIFFRESVLYPFVQLNNKGKHYELASDERMQITRFIEESQFGRL